MNNHIPDFHEDEISYPCLNFDTDFFNKREPFFKRMNMKDNVSFAATLSTNWKKLPMSQDSTRLLGPDDLLRKNICLLLNRHYILSQTHYRRTFENRKY